MHFENRAKEFIAKLDVLYKRRVKEIQKHEQLEGCHQSETGKASDGKEKGELCLRHKWRHLVEVGRTSLKYRRATELEI